MSFEYDALTHTYTLDGRRLPSVTECLGLLQNFDSIPWETLERARQRGQRVHEHINAYNRGDITEADFPPDISGHLEGWAKFMDDTGAVVIQSERPLYHKALGYGGTPDCILSWKDDKALLLPDVKATWAVPPTVGAQTAAYAEAYKSHNGKVRIERACIHLTAGGYKLHMRTDPADWSLFVSTLNVYRFLEKNHA